MKFNQSKAGVHFVGTCTRDAECKTVKGDKTVANFSMVTERGWGDNRVSTFWNVEVWGKAAEFAGADLKKGMPVVVVGEIFGRKYTSEGVEKTVMQVVADAVSYVREPKGEAQPAQSAKPATQSSAPSEDW